MVRFGLVFGLLLASSVAHAADPAEPSVDPARFGWDGAYVGLSAGHGWVKDVDNSFTPPFHDQGDDWIFGVHAGYLVGLGNFVVGGEVEATKLDITYDAFSFITLNNAFTVRAKAGYAFDRFLVSAHGGAGYLTTNFMGLKDWGWNYGAGVDYALTDMVTVGAQYSRYEFNDFDGTQIDGHIDTATARVGLKF